MRLLLVAGLLGAISTVTGATQRFEPPVEVRAAKLAGALVDMRWGTALDDWRQEREDDGFCRSYRHQTLGDRYGYSRGLNDASTPWAVWCQHHEPRELQDYIFYTIRDDAPVAAGLERIVWRLTVADLPALRDAVERALDAKLGPADRLSLATVGADNRSIPGRDSLPDEWTEVAVSDARRWRSSESEIFLYVYDDRDDVLPPQLVFRARSRQLVDALAKDERFVTALELVNPLEDAFLNRLRADSPDVAALLTERGPLGRGQIEAQPRIRAAINRIAQQVRDAEATERPFLMLVLDRLAFTLWFQEGDRLELFNADARRLMQLEDASQDDGWWYPGGLRWRVWREQPDTQWGDYAFFQLLLDGFGANAIYDQDSVEEVLKFSDEFLFQRPDSPARPLVMFVRALAADTIWSVSVAPSYDFCVGGTGDSAAKRLRAIAAYDDALRPLADNDPRRAYAQRQRLQLRAGYDTGTRHFVDCYP